jgi:hypothetical protein
MLAEDLNVSRPAAKEDLGWLRLVPSLYTVAFLAIIGAVFIIALAPRIDTDYWWHLKVGQYIANHHVVPSHDFMSFTMVGHSWTDHEWLAELALFGLYRLGGLWGPDVFFAILITATFSLLYLNITQRNIHRVLATFIVAMAFMASSASWGPRIQMVTLFFLAAYGLILQRFAQTRDRRLLVALPLLMLVWTNLHGGFVLGLVIVTLNLAGEWLNRVTRREGAWERDDLKVLLYALIAAAAITIVNPNGVRQLLYPLTFVLPNAYTNLIEESASPNFHMPVMMVFEAMLLLLVTSLLITRERLNWTHLFVIVAFTHLAFSQVRNVAVWSVVVTPLLAYYIQATGPRLKELFPQFSYRRRPVAGRTGQILNLVLLLMVLVVYVGEGTHFINRQTMRTAETSAYPTRAIAYLQHHHLPQRVFVSYGWGGYLLWHLFPTYRDYMDSRADTLYNKSILNGYLSLYAASPAWRSTLQTYRIQDVLVEPGAPIAQVLAGDKQWRLAYHDGGSVLYVRRGASS